MRVPLLLWVRAHISLDRRAPLPVGRTVGPNHIIAHRSRNNKGFRVVDNERREAPSRALNHRLPAFTQVQDIHAAMRRMLHWSGEPVASRFDKFTFVKSRAIFLPSGALGNRFNDVDKIVFDPRRGPLPLNISKPVLEMDG